MLSRYTCVLLTRVYTFRDVADVVNVSLSERDTVSIPCHVSTRYSMLTYAVIPAKSLVSLPGRSRAYLPPLASNTLLVPSRLAFLQRSTSGTVGLRLS